MITLHHLDRSRSMRILWALEELEIDYELKNYQRLPNLSAPPELKAVHPLGKAPILTDDDKVIAESAVILDYLQSRYDQKQQFKPLTGESLMQYNYWMHYAEASLMPLLVFNLVMEELGGEQVPRLVRPITKQFGAAIRSQFTKPRFDDHVPFIENYLSEHEYFAGDHFSFADVQMLLPLQGVLLSETSRRVPHITAYAKRMTDRPAYQRACAKSPDGGKLER